MESIGYNQGRVNVIANALSPTGVSPVTHDAGLSFVGAQPNPASTEVNLVLELDYFSADHRDARLELAIPLREPQEVETGPRRR